MKPRRILTIILIVVLGLVLLEGAVRIAGFVSVVSTGLTIHTSADDVVIDAPGTVRFEYTALSPLLCRTSCEAQLIRHDTNEVIARSELGAFSSGSINASIPSESSLKRVPVQLILTCTTEQTRYCSIDEQVSADIAIVRFDLDDEQHAIRTFVLEERERLEEEFSEHPGLLQALSRLSEPYEHIADLARDEYETYTRSIERFLTGLRAETYTHPPDVPQAIRAWRREEEAHPRAVELSERIAERLTILYPYRSRYQDDRSGFENLTRTYRELDTSALRAYEALVRIDEQLDRIEGAHERSILTGAYNSAQSTTRQFEAVCAILNTSCPEPIERPETIRGAYELNRQLCERVALHHEDPYTELLAASNLTYEEADEMYNITHIRENTTFLELERAVLSNLSLASNLRLAERLAMRIPLGASYCSEPFEAVSIGLPLFTTRSEAVPIDVLGERTCALGTCEHEARTPILFIHGHSITKSTDPRYNLQGLTRLAHAFEAHGYLYAGHLFPTVTRDIERFDAPVSFTATYYVNSYEEEGEVRLRTFKSESIETYALRLREDIEEAKRITGSDRVVLVAHSMGGLVARSYLDLFGSESVEQLIMIGTPNHGITERTERLCPILGASIECRDMTRGSVFLRRLNQQPLPDIPMHLIAGDGCDLGDGVVALENALFEGIDATIINGTCIGIETLHSHLIDPRVHPETLEIIAAQLSR